MKSAKKTHQNRRNSNFFTASQDLSANEFKRLPSVSKLAFQIMLTMIKGAEHKRMKIRKLIFRAGARALDLWVIGCGHEKRLCEMFNKYLDEIERNNQYTQHSNSKGHLCEYYYSSH